MQTTSLRKLVTLIAFALPFALSAATLKVGDPAPALDVGAWIKGAPVSAFAPGKVYLVEFWATWCSPCNAAMPKLSELQKQHPDRLVIIGVDVRERIKGDAVLPFVKAYVEKKGDKMAYTVGMDDPVKQAMYNTWLVAAETTGVPATFIVDVSGRIAFIGHPFKDNMLAFSDEFTAALNRALAGQTGYDAGQAIQDEAKARKDEFQWQREQQAPVKALLAKGEYQAALKAAEEGSASDSKAAAALFEVKFLALVHLDVMAARAALKQETDRGGMVGRFESKKWARILAYYMMEEKNLSDDALRLAVEVATKATVDQPEDTVGWQALAKANHQLHQAAAAIAAQQRAVTLAIEQDCSDYDIEQMKLKLTEYSR